MDKEFFKELFPDFDKNKNVIDVFPFDSNKNPIKKYRKFCLTIDEVITYAKQLNTDKKYNIYFRCPELKPGSIRGTEEDIAQHTFLYADLDVHEKDKEGNIIKTHTKDEILQRIDNFKLKPSIIVDSGNGYHVYFLLKEPLIDKKLTRQLLSAINTALQSDKNSTKLTQLLRVPGTYNLKEEQPKEVKIIRFSKHRYAIDELSSLLLKNTKEPVPQSKKQNSNSTGVSDGHICFNLAAPPPPLNITVNDFPELLSILKKQNIFLASNRPDYPLGKTFNCIFHNDEHPSANIFVSRSNGYYYYKCFGCGRLYDIITIYQETKKQSFTESIRALAKFFGIKFEYPSWIVRMWEKYYQNASIIENFEDLGYQEMYPNLYKLIKPRIKYLSLINHYGLAKISSEEYIYDDENLFFFSYEYFSKKYNVSLQTLIRDVNLFATLGLIRKIPIEDVPPKIATRAVLDSKSKKHFNTVNFYTLPNFQDVFPEAEQRAKKLLDNNFSITKCMNKIFLIKVFGQDFANQIYPDERVITSRSLSLAKRLETTLLKLIETQGYATKDQIVSKTIVSGRLKATREEKERELQRNLAFFIKDHNLKYVTANKELKERFKLKGYIKIIIPQD